MTEISQHNLGYSLNNIPHPPENTYLKKLIQQTESFIKRIRWRAFWFDNDQQQDPSVNPTPAGHETYGFKSTNTPPQHPDLLHFETELYDLIRNIKFNPFKSQFQQQMDKDLKELKTGNNVVVEADKTTNLYKVSVTKYRELLQNNVTKDYKIAAEGKQAEIDRRTNILAQHLKIEDRMEQHTATPAFITLKDHKDNFSTDTKCRLINPAKSNLGIVSKKLLEKFIKQIKTNSGHNLWKSSAEVLNWFSQTNTASNARFLKFDICEFYPSISSALLNKALHFARSYINITEDEEEIIKLSKEALLFSNNNCWEKKNNPEFDVTMGSYDGAETAELIGLYLLSKISRIIPNANLGLYRDDSLALIPNANGPMLDRTRKQLHELFKEEGLKITVDICGGQVDFLDIILDADQKSHRPYKKPNDTPLYINTQSNHPKNIIGNIPDMISKRLSTLSSNENRFLETRRDYEIALRNSGHTEELKYQQPWSKNTKRRRKRNVTWFNPPFSSNVSTNIGRKFFNILDRHFPPHHHLHKILNRNTVKLSYCCMPNVGQILKAHNKKVLNQDSTEDKDKPCNCRNKTNCPLQGKCQTKSVIYQADVKQEDGTIYSYIGLTEHTFKKRWYNHCQSFKHRRYETSTELSKLIWKLKDEGTQYTITWRILTKCQAYKPGSRACNLCTTEKLLILQNPTSINSRSELVSKCRHARKFLIMNF